MPVRARAVTRWLPVVATVLVAVIAAGSASAGTATTRRVSVSTAGTAGNGGSYSPSLSAGGRYVAFESAASNLVGGDSNGVYDVFLRDRGAGTTRRISLSSSERQGNGPSYSAAISADGRFVAFASDASNLVRSDTNGLTDVFVRDLQAGTTTRVSVRTSGSEANGVSYEPSISGDGRFVAFQSNASNLVGGDTNGAADIMVRDLRAGTTARVSVRTNGDQANGDSSSAAISSDGHVVALRSNASNLVASDTNAVADIFVRDRQRHTTARMSVRTTGTEADDQSSVPAISADGRFVAFGSQASNLVSGDTNGAFDVFMHDRGAGTTKVVSVSSGGALGDGASAQPEMSADGRWVVFRSAATDLAGLDTNNADDIFIHDRRTGTTRRISLNSNRAEGNDYSDYPAISADGRFAAFSSSSTNLIPGDTNGTDDIFTRGPLS